MNIYLPFHEAVIAAAKQNFEHDVREDVEDVVWEKLPDDVRGIYLEEAEVVLKEYGENYVPEYDDHLHIKVKTRSG